MGMISAGQEPSVQITVPAFCLPTPSSPPPPPSHTPCRPASHLPPATWLIRVQGTAPRVVRSAENVLFPAPWTPTRISTARGRRGAPAPLLAAGTGSGSPCMRSAGPVHGPMSGSVLINLCVSTANPSRLSLRGWGPWSANTGSRCRQVVSADTPRNPGRDRPGLPQYLCPRAGRPVTTTPAEREHALSSSSAVLHALHTPSCFMECNAGACPGLRHWICSLAAGGLVHPASAFTP